MFDVEDQLDLVSMISNSEETKFSWDDFDKIEYLNMIDDEPAGSLEEELAQGPEFWNEFDNMSSMSQRLADVMHQSPYRNKLQPDQQALIPRLKKTCKGCDKVIIYPTSNTMFDFHHIYMSAMPMVTIQTIQANGPESGIVQLKITNPNMGHLKIKFEQHSHELNSCSITLPQGPLTIEY